MGEDIEQRLFAAAAALHEYEAATARAAELRTRLDEIGQRVAALRAAQASEQHDVARLESLSLTRILATWHGSWDDDVARERAEAEAATYRLAQAQAQDDAARAEGESVRATIERLAGAGEAYAALLDEKERLLAGSDDPRARQLLELADERGRVTAQLREVGEATEAAQAAAQALARLRGLLASAHSWSTYDTFFGGGLLSSAIKHSRLDEAARLAADADRRLVVLRAEIADVDRTAKLGGPLALGGLTRFVDVWFDNIFTDLSVRDRIKQAQGNADAAAARVAAILADLGARAQEGGRMLAAAEARRRGLLAQP